MKKHPHWRRDEPQWFNVHELSWDAHRDIRIAHGVDSRVISRDAAESGSTTMMLRVPADWHIAQPSEEATLELLVIEGDVSVEGQRHGAGGFIAISPGCGTVELSSEGGAQLVLFYNPELSPEHCYGGELYTMETWSTDWTPFVQAADQRHGLMYKSLRVPDVTAGTVHGGPGGMLRLVLILPGYTSPDHEYHEDSWEEIIFVSGDIVMPNRGIGHAGTVLCNPASLEHGPYASQRSSVMICHGLNPQPTAYTALPGSQEAMAHYLNTESLFDEELRTETWDDRPAEDAVLQAHSD
jgi:hypothetical protein